MSSHDAQMQHPEGRCCLNWTTASPIEGLPLIMNPSLSFFDFPTKRSERNSLEIYWIPTFSEIYWIPIFSNHHVWKKNPNPSTKMKSVMIRSWEGNHLTPSSFACRTLHYCSSYMHPPIYHACFESPRLSMVSNTLDFYFFGCVQTTTCCYRALACLHVQRHPWM